MAVVRKKQDDKFLKVLRELVTTGAGNRQCFDCGQKGPTYVNMTIGSFVCTRCSGVLRGLTPPHRVKSISMATFTQEEIDFLRAHGNDLCAKTWLGLWDPKRAVHQDHRELMIDKYERKRYYLEPASPLKSLTNAASLKNGSNISSSSNGNSANNNNSNKNASSTTTAHVLHQQQLKNGYGNHMTNGNGTTTNSSCSSTSSSSNNNNNSSAINVNSSNKVQAGGGFDSSFQNITLTPPTSQRTTQNGLHKSSSTAISRPQNGYHHQAQSQSQSRAADRPGDSSYNAVRNGFGADADFVADFGSANIFDATAAISLGSTAAASAASSNGYAKILPMKATQIMNGVAGGGNHSAVATLMMNGNIRNQQNGTNGHIINSNNSNNNNGSSNNNNTKSTSENFADFDHAPIFNAAENYKFVRKRNLKKSSPMFQEKFQLQQQQQREIPISAATTAATEDEKENSRNNTKNINNFYDLNRWHDFNSLKDGRKMGWEEEKEESAIVNNCFNDFSLNRHNNGKIASATSNYYEVEHQQQQQQQTKFTPLAMAAHATAMAVLGSHEFDVSSSHDTTEWSRWHGVDSVATPITSTDWDNFWESNSRSSSAALSHGSFPKPLSSFPATPASNDTTHCFNHTIAPVQSSHSVQSSSFPLTFTPVATEATATAAPFLSTNPFLPNTNFNLTHPDTDFPSSSTAGFLAHRRSSSSVPDENSNVDFVRGWRLPMTNGYSNKQHAASAKSTTTANNMSNNQNNNNRNQTPAADRYAALKDLDEQLRESKAVAAAAAAAVVGTTNAPDAFGNNNNNNVGTNVNPFKLQQQQHAAMANPFQATQQQQQQPNLFGQMSTVTNGNILTNGFQQPISAQQQQQQAQQQQHTAFYNYSSGYTAAGAAASTMFPPPPAPSSGPNGCGFGFGSMQQQIAAAAGGGGGGGGAFNNPFAATGGAVNSNNPFL